MKARQTLSKALRTREGRRYVLRKRADRRGVYYFRLLADADPHRPWRSTGATNRPAAIRYVEAWRGGAAKGTLADYATDFFRWGVCQWIERQHAKGRPFSRTVAAMRRAHLERYVLPRFGTYRLADFNPVEVEDWLRGLPLANQTRNHLLYTLRIVTGEWSRELREPAPLSNAEPMGSTYRERDVLTMDELGLLFPADRQQLLEVWGRDPRVATLFMVLAGCGLRMGEALALEWRHNPPGGLLIEQAVKGDGSIGTTKTREQRAVIVPRRTQAALDWWRPLSEHAGDDDLVFYGRASRPGSERYREHRSGCGYAPLNKTTAAAAFRPALQRAGIELDGRTLVPHSLRHGYNTALRPLLAGEVLRRLTGHKTAAMSDRYDHTALLEELQQLEEVRAAVDGVFA